MVRVGYYCLSIYVNVYFLYIVKYANDIYPAIYMKKCFIEFSCLCCFKLIVCLFV